MLKTIPMKDAALVQVHGRTTACREPLTLFWSASGLEMNLKAGELWVEFETDYSVHAQWVSVLLNGAHIGRFLLPKGRVWMPILHGLNPEKVNHIEIIRDVQAMPTDPDCILQIHALRTDGEFVPVEPKTMKLEIIGDSITSAEGSIGAKEETDWIAPLFCSARGYAFTTAKALNADLHVLSQSGWGALTSWDNDPHCALPLYYDQVCGVVKGEKNAALGAFEENDFAAWSADVVVVNLGVNDNSAFKQPAWVDPETGISYKQRSNEDGTHNAEDEGKLRKAMYDFLVKIRAKNPHAYILWVHGMLGNPLKDFIADMVRTYCADTGDDRAEFFELPNEPLSGIGARNHPGKPMHDTAAEALIAKIRSL